MPKLYLETISNNRRQYLDSLSEEYGVPQELVDSLAYILGENEDYDGLVSSIEDAAYMFEFYGEW